MCLSVIKVHIVVSFVCIFLVSLHDWWYHLVFITSLLTNPDSYFFYGPVCCLLLQSWCFFCFVARFFCAVQSPFVLVVVFCAVLFGTRDLFNSICVWW